ncbi:nucleotidyltransferase family protein [Methanospirillum sp. J.3.6.1-F.2.7.3]|jgi:Predicted nucleotidyltransferases|uniref:Nucleotidyltransferase family protein n=1 Tax=Methanospirillum purgamenti TaxID=2834276 RepID=A0A8E7EIR3_9EURY|nr:MULTISPECIES: nucleotidyltransferase family protein [Methanospirillum]MDX8550206.1 nucleotidyltransferase family protein [Methanospirillum hungatei]NLW75889.1 nucleotidyltransferase family protein [Methanomicrobiales archaeon]QVV90402.1 nucleotidyltransferase family protein [Methanospirillum sp. J.3.6.1-F.2.7.3]
MTQAMAVLETLKSIKPQLASQYHIRRFGLFGSVIRGEQTPDSDIDILVEFETAPSIFGFLELEEKLEEVLLAPVDLVDIEGIKPLLRSKILSEVQYV